MLHDWSDLKSRQILRNTIPGLVKGRSKILLVENVLSDTGAHAFSSLMDIRMMTYNGMGRKESQWRDLVESAGLKLVKVWPGVKNDRVLEVVLQDS